MYIKHNSRIIKRSITITTIILFSGCKLFQPTAYFFVSNTSENKTPVDIQIKIGEQSVFSDSIHLTNIAPDLQYTPSITLTKGKYTIFITADSGKTYLTKPIMLDGDRWIFVSFNYNDAPDSLQRAVLIKHFGYDTAYMNRRLRGTPSKLGIFIMDKEPIHM